MEWAVSAVWLARLPDTEEVTDSSSVLPIFLFLERFALHSKTFFYFAKVLEFQGLAEPASRRLAIQNYQTSRPAWGHFWALLAPLFLHPVLSTLDS